MDGSDGAVGKKARRALFATLFATAVTAAPPAAIGQSFPSSSAAGISGGLLPREFVVSRRLVGQIFPEIVQTASTGRNGTAVGNPEATRAAIYSNADGTKLMTVRVDATLPLAMRQPHIGKLETRAGRFRDLGLFLFD
jgi:hypothetical protein